MKTTILLTSALLAPLCSAPPCWAQPADSRPPEQVVKTTIDQVMAAVHADPGAGSGDPDATYRIVQQRFLPATDFLLTTQYAVGKAWAEATPAQREAVFRQFQTLLARTYALQLTQIQGQDTRFKYAPPRLAADALDAVVKTTVQTGGDTMAIDYRMRKTGAGWKIYDINMMGAWMIQVYRKQFASRLAAGGMDGLVKYLAAHNEMP